jgi:heptosyltransferase-2
MNTNSRLHIEAGGSDSRPILLVPYMWIGDFVRCHSVVTLLRQRFPLRPIDVLATTLCAPLADYMPGVRQAIVADLPRGRIALARQMALAARLKREGYGVCSCSTTCVLANGNCRAPSTAARRWRSRAAPRCRRHGRCRS